jgi:hypothetical protein
MMQNQHTSRQVNSPAQNNRTAAVVLLVGWLAVMLSSCVSGDHNQPTFENLPAVLAQAPCVANVCIGAVGREGVKEALARDELLYNIRDNGGAPVWFSIEQGGVGGVIFSRDEFGAYKLVERIELHVVGMPLGKVFDTLGEPDELFLMFGCGRGYHVHGKLFYRDKGIEAQVQFPVKMDDRAEPVILDDKTPMVWMWYFDPARYDEWLMNIHDDLRIRSGYFDIAPVVTAESLVASVQPWQGIGAPVEPLDLCPR